jgi:hypothetical protein
MGCDAAPRPQDFLVIFFPEGGVEDLNRRQSVQFRSLDFRDQPDGLSFVDDFHYIAVESLVLQPSEAFFIQRAFSSSP